MTRSTVITVFVLLGIIGLAAWFAFSGGGASDTETAQLPFVSPVDSPFTDIEGNPIDFSEFDNQVRVINSWASWCPFCVNELPDLDTLAAEYQSDNVVVIAINRKEPAKTVRNYLGTIPALSNVIVALDPTDSFYSSVGGFTMPETIFYNQAGEVVVHKRGFMNLEEMRRHTEAALSQ